MHTVLINNTFIVSSFSIVTLHLLSRTFFVEIYCIKTLLVYISNHNIIFIIVFKDQNGSDSAQDP